jgi:phosphorylcholine metabolism protein LicD
MLEVIDNLFAKEGIEYCATSGTQLGITRNQGIIPNDDDADIAVLLNDRKKILSLGKELKQYGLDIVECDFGFKIFELNSKNHKITDHFSKMGDVQYTIPFIDLIFVQEMDNKVMYSDESFRTYYAGDYFTVNDWKARKKISFGPIQIYGLPGNRGISYCNRAYTSACFKYSYSAYDHINAGITIPKKIYLKYEKGKTTCPSIEYDAETFKNAFKIPRDSVAV